MQGHTGITITMDGSVGGSDSIKHFLLMCTLARDVWWHGSLVQHVQFAQLTKWAVAQHAILGNLMMCLNLTHQLLKFPETMVYITSTCTVI
jgi:hypothetical protein